METEKLQKMEEKRLKRQEYMRAYMKERYHKGGEKTKLYNNTLKSKAKNSLSTDDFKNYGLYLGDICELRKLKNKIPNILWKSFILEFND